MAARYVALVKKHRENVARERRKYGDNREPPRTSNEVNESLMSEGILKEALLKRLVDEKKTGSRRDEYKGRRRTMPEDS